MIRAGAFLAATVLPTAAAFAQPVTQIPQVSDERPSVVVTSLPSVAAPAEPLAQITTDRRNPAAETQLTSGQASRQQPAQLSSGEASRQQPAQLSNDRPSAQPPQPLSRPADGRTAAVQRVEGDDRCDPAVEKDRQPQACERVIETRADDYTRPDPTELSPEQRLLLEQEIEHAGEGVTDATHRLATSGETENSNEAMGIAAIVLSQQAPPPKEPGKPEDPANQAAVAAIIQMIGGTPPN